MWDKKGNDIMPKIPYGYTFNPNGCICIDEIKASIIKDIFSLYLAGDSLGRISHYLASKQISSPTGNAVWARAALDKLLSNKKYVPHIISFDSFLMVQAEKTRRSNIDIDTGERAARRYTSPQPMYSGIQR